MQDHEIAEMLQQLAREPAHVLAGRVEHLDGREDRRDIALQDRRREILKGRTRDETEDACLDGFVKKGSPPPFPGS